MEEENTLTYKIGLPYYYSVVFLHFPLYKLWKTTEQNIVPITIFS